MAKKKNKIESVESADASNVASTKVFVGGGSFRELNALFDKLCDPPFGFLDAVDRTIALSKDGHTSWSQFYNNSRFTGLDGATLKPWFEKWMSFAESHGRAERINSLFPEDQIFVIR